MVAVCDLLSCFVLYKHTKIGQKYYFFLNCANKKCFILLFCEKIVQNVYKSEFCAEKQMDIGLRLNW